MCCALQVQDFRFLCPNGTAFDQDHQICAEWEDVDCDATTLYYSSDNFDLYRLGSGKCTFTLFYRFSTRVIFFNYITHRKYTSVNGLITYLKWFRLVRAIDFKLKARKSIDFSAPLIVLLCTMYVIFICHLKRHCCILHNICIRVVTKLVCLRGSNVSMWKRFNFIKGSRQIFNNFFSYLHLIDFCLDIHWWK